MPGDCGYALVVQLALKRPLIIFDLETTGLDPEKDRIIELAAIKIWSDGRQEEKKRRFNPQIPIPLEATQVHGITDEDVKNELPFSRYAHGEEGIAAYFAGADLAGFNIVSFDIPMLKTELERAHERLDLTEVYIIDAYRIFTTKEPRDLEAALKFYCHKEHSEAHSALGDVRATLDVLIAQLEYYPDIPHTPREIDLSFRPPDAVDRTGRLRMQHGEITISFGRHKGRTLKYLAQEEPDYLRWMLENDVIPDASRMLRDALVGFFTQPGKVGKKELDRESDR